MNVTAVREAIRDALDGLELFEAISVRGDETVQAYPAAVVSIDAATAETLGDDGWLVNASILVLVSVAEPSDGWQAHDDLLSDETLAEALREMPISAGLVSFDDIGQPFTTGGQSYLSFVINVAVYA